MSKRITKTYTLSKTAIKALEQLEAKARDIFGSYMVKSRIIETLILKKYGENIGEVEKLFNEVESE